MKTPAGGRRAFSLRFLRSFGLTRISPPVPEMPAPEGDGGYFASARAAWAAAMRAVGTR